MATIPGGSSGKRRELERELRDTESAIARKCQELEAAEMELSRTKENAQRWNDTIFSLTKGEVAIGIEAKVEHEAKVKHATAEQNDAEAKVDAVEAKVESLRKELNMLEVQQRTTEQLVAELGPSASSYFRATARLGAPSDLTSYHAWWKAQRLDSNNDHPLFLCFVPPEAQPEMPVELAEEVFSQFLVNAAMGDVVDNDDCHVVADLCELVGNELQNDWDMAWPFRIILSRYLGSDFPVQVGSLPCKQKPSLFHSDGSVMIGNRMALLAELKLDPKTTLFQAMQYYAFYLEGLEERQKESSFCPCFLIELVGTCIRISGLVYFQKVACQPLTPFLHCYVNLFDRSDMNTLCRAMRALKVGVHKLRDMGGAAVTRNKNIPYQLCSPGWEFQKRIAGKLVFVMKERESGELKVVKFCRRYGVSVHGAWAEQGLAPRLIHHCRQPDGWYAIEMEYLDPNEWKSIFEWCSSNDTSQTVISKSQLLETISNALARAHQIILDGSKTVHGNMRNPNIMVRQRDEDGSASFEVKFLDFDWSGIVGETVYPTFMNMDFKWHPDVRPGKPLRQEHDTHWLGELMVGSQLCKADV